MRPTKRTLRFAILSVLILAAGLSALLKPDLVGANNVGCSGRLRATALDFNLCAPASDDVCYNCIYTDSFGFILCTENRTGSLAYCSPGGTNPSGWPASF